MNIFSKTALFLSFALSFSANAEFLDINDTVIQDVDSGTQWVKLTQTKGMSIVSAQDMLETNARYEGFRVATYDEVMTLFNSYFQVKTINWDDSPDKVQSDVSKTEASVVHDAFGQTNTSWEASYGYVLGESSPSILGSDINSSISYFYQHNNRGINETYSSGGVYLIKGSFNDVPALGLFMLPLLPFLFKRKKAHI